MSRPMLPRPAANTDALATWIADLRVEVAVPCAAPCHSAPYHRDASPTMLPDAVRADLRATLHARAAEVFEAPRPDPCDCSMCGGTHVVVGSMGHERACDYCACAAEVFADALSDDGLDDGELPTEDRGASLVCAPLDPPTPPRFGPPPRHEVRGDGSACPRCEWDQRVARELGL